MRGYHWRHWTRSALRTDNYMSFPARIALGTQVERACRPLVRLIKKRLTQLPGRP